MAIYIILISLLVFFGIIEYKNVFSKKLNLFIYIILFSFVTFLAAFRKNTVGVDTMQYYRTYTFYLNLNWDFSSMRYEYGYSLFVKILTLFSDDPQTLIIVSSIFINLSMAIFIKKYSPYPILSILLYVLLREWMGNMNVLREAMALSIVLLAFPLSQKKSVRSIILFELIVGVAVMFHTSALFCLIIPFIRFIKINNISLIFIIFISLFLFIFARQIFSVLSNMIGKYSGYGENEYSESNYFGTLIKFFFYLYIFISLLYMARKNEYELHGSEVTSQDSVFLKINLIHLIALVMVVQMAIFNRISGLFSVFYVISIPYYIKKAVSREEKIVGLVLIIICLIYFFILAILRPEWNGCIPYEFFK